MAALAEVQARIIITVCKWLPAGVPSLERRHAQVMSMIRLLMRARRTIMLDTPPSMLAVCLDPALERPMSTARRDIGIVSPKQCVACAGVLTMRLAVPRTGVEEAAEGRPGAASMM
jgi:hypothetical protein